MKKDPVQVTPGDDLHLTLLMAPQSLNFVTGQDREHLLAYGRSAFEAGQASKCLHQITEPAAAALDVSISSQEWRDVCHQFFIRHSRAPLIGDPDFFNSIAKIAVKKFAATQSAAQRLVALTSAERDVIAERQRQISVKGWTPEHDDAYNPGVLALHGGLYACHAHDNLTKKRTPEGWQWDAKWWKSKDPRSNLVKAGALILAEIERIDRSCAAQAKEGGAA